MEGGSLRKCASIKSRKQPGSPCTSVANYGDFCFRHYKNPIRFQPSKLFKQDHEESITKRHTDAAFRIQRTWRRWSLFARWRRQGPAANALDLAQNTTEICSLEPISTIPLVFLFSFADAAKNIWVFDIRSLSHLLTEGAEVLNPYTRIQIPHGALTKIHTRSVWLRERRYPTLYATEENLTQAQVWNQKVLDVFFKMEELGYRASCRWFDEMDITDHEDFYRKLYRLWNYHLGLTEAEKESILPGHNSSTQKLFRHTPEKLQGGTHDLKWWRRNNLNLILEFLTRASQKSQQALGALYVLMALVQVVPNASIAYPWIRETLTAVY